MPTPPRMLTAAASASPEGRQSSPRAVGFDLASPNRRAMMAEGALHDVVVLELAQGAAGSYTGKLLADLGAQVIKVEPESSDSLRNDRPIVDGESVFFDWLNANKLGAHLSLQDDRLGGLLRHADIVIHSERGPDAERLEVRVRAANTRAVVLSLTPYGLTGDRAWWHATALTEYATGGFHYFGGAPAREPLSLPGYQVEYHAGQHGAIAALAGLWHARNTGEGQRIEVSHQEAILVDQAWLTTSWSHLGQVQRRTGSIYAKCSDGFVYLFNLVPYPNLFILMERFDLLEDQELQNPLNWAPRFGEVLKAFSAWTATKTKQQVYHACQELRIAASPINTMEDVANSEQLAAREWFETVETAGKSFVAPGFPYRLMATPCANRFPAPRFGKHTEAVLDPGFAWANAGVAPPVAKPAAGKGPLHGLRLIEVTANWAGPIGGRHFGDLGADVVKVELATKPATRALIYVGDELWPNHFNRSGYFNKINRNKRDICLDLSKPEGKEVFLDLVRCSDALIENNAARVMTQLGLGYESLAEVNPSLVMCSMSGYGSTGPERNYSAYGSNIETVSGLASLLGYGPGEFFGTGSFYADPVTGNHGAVALLAALHARRTTGRGQWIDMALLEAVAPFFGQQFLEYSVSGESPVPMANRSHEMFPHDVYPAAGKDCWLAIAVRDRAEFGRLAAVIGRPDWAQDPTFATTEGRRARGAEIDDAIRAWSATVDQISAANTLQAVGIPAAPVMPNWQILSDNHLHDRGFFLTIRHPVAGTHWFPGFPWKFERTPAALDCPAPTFAEHNFEVLSGLLGLSSERIRELYDAGITSDAPIYATGPSP